MGRVEAFTRRLGVDLVMLALLSERLLVAPAPLALEPETERDSRRSTPESSKPPRALRLPLASTRLCLALGMGGRQSASPDSLELMASERTPKAMQTYNTCTADQL